MAKRSKATETSAPSDHDLRAEIIAGLSARRPSVIELPIVLPVERPFGVLSWMGEFDTHCKLLKIHEDRVVAFHVKVRDPRGPREPATIDDGLVDVVAKFLDSINAEELERAEAVGHVLRFDDARFEGFPFTSFAIIPPAAAEYRIGAACDDLLLPRTYVAFPCYECEIPLKAKPHDLKMQTSHMSYTDLGRTPQAFARTAYYRIRMLPDQKSGSRKWSKPITTAGLSGSLSSFPTIDIENWVGDVLRVGPTEAISLKNGASVAIESEDDAANIIERFLTTGEFG